MIDSAIEICTCILSQIKMYAWLYVKYPTNKKLIANSQASIRALDILFIARAGLCNFERVKFKVGIEFKVFPDVVTKEKSGGCGVIPFKLW